MREDTVNTDTAPLLRLTDRPLLIPGLARAHVAALSAGTAPPRVLISGPAGSGKSGILRHLRRELAASGVVVVMLHGRLDIASVPVEHVLMIDDAHTLDAAQLAALAERASDPDAGIILAARPWPRSGEFTALADELERAQAAIVLGTIGPTDLRTYVAQTGDELHERCHEVLRDATGGTAWLLNEALTAHATSGCSGEPQHDGLDAALRDVIAHRVRALSPDARELVERVCVSADDSTHPGEEQAALSAYADGLLLLGGRPAPVVRSAVRAVASVDRVIGLYASAVANGADPDAAGDEVDRLVEGVSGQHLAGILLRHGDAVLATDPRRARDLYRRARDAGAESAAVAIREAQAEFGLGAVETAGRLLDGVTIPVEHPDHDAAADTAAAVWAARGFARMSDAVYRAFVPRSPASHARATVAAFAVADDGLRDAAAHPAPPTTMPSTLEVSMELLEVGLRETLTATPQRALGDLVRAAEMYSATRTSSPLTELPAVVAALAALHLGEPEIALSTLDRALDEGHGGSWAHDRLILWRAWVALQLERAHDAEAALESLAVRAHALSPRERLLFDAVSVSIARRYHDTVALTAAWRAARETLMRASFDLFGLLLLGEFVTTAARLGEPERVQPHFAEALARLDRLGTPPLWSAHLHWAGIQQAILLGRPDDLQPHARALLGAAPHSRPAAVMTQAGRVWTAVLSGRVDADAVEESAIALGSIGLAWDGARLAGHGAGHVADRRTSARLLAVARRLHPHEDIRPPAVESEVSAPSRARTASDLSPRELEVAALVVQGKTYSEIGATIFISPRTAEHHIARIRRRLGATNRSDLIAKLRIALDDAETDDSGERGARASA